MANCSACRTTESADPSTAVNSHRKISASQAGSASRANRVSPYSRNTKQVPPLKPRNHSSRINPTFARLDGFEARISLLNDFNNGRQRSSRADPGHSREYEVAASTQAG